MVSKLHSGRNQTASQLFSVSKNHNSKNRQSEVLDLPFCTSTYLD